MLGLLTFFLTKVPIKNLGFVCVCVCVCVCGLIHAFSFLTEQEKPHYQEDAWQAQN
jgi:hypothetical protein